MSDLKRHVLLYKRELSFSTFHIIYFIIPLHKDYNITVLVKG